MADETSNAARPPRRLARTARYESNWINVYADRVQLPSGRIVEPFHVLTCSSEAAAGLVENDAGEILLARVWRYAPGVLEWEIPGGRIDPGETPAAAAQREVLEETGWQTRDATPLYTYYPIEGLSDQRFHIVRCRATRQVHAIDTDEIASAHWFTRARISAMIDKREIRNGLTLCALLLWLRG